MHLLSRSALAGFAGRTRGPAAVLAVLASCSVLGEAPELTRLRIAARDRAELAARLVELPDAGSSAAPAVVELWVADLRDVPRENPVLAEKGYAFFPLWAENEHVTLDYQVQAYVSRPCELPFRVDDVDARRILWEHHIPYAATSSEGRASLVVPEAFEAQALAVLGRGDADPSIVPTLPVPATEIRISAASDAEMRARIAKIPGARAEGAPVAIAVWASGDVELVAPDDALLTWWEESLELRGYRDAGPWTYKSPHHRADVRIESFFADDVDLGGVYGRTIVDVDRLLWERRIPRAWGISNYQWLVVPRSLAASIVEIIEANLGPGAVNFKGPEDWDESLAWPEDLDLVHAISSPVESTFDPLPLMRATNVLRSRSKADVMACLREFNLTANDFDGSRVPGDFTTSDRAVLPLLCRVLFEVPEGADHPSTGFLYGAVPRIPAGERGRWPQFPLALVDDVPVLMWGWNGWDVPSFFVGRPEDRVDRVAALVRDLLDWYEAHGTLRAKSLAPSGDPLAAIDAFFDREDVDRLFETRPTWSRVPLGTVANEPFAVFQRQQMLRAVRAAFADDLPRVTTDDWLSNVGLFRDEPEWRKARTRAAELDIEWDSGLNEFVGRR